MAINEYMQSVIAEVVTVLKKGGVIIYPTDTVWGIGCDATNEQAVRRIFDLKQRPESKSMILLVDSPDSLKPFISQLTDEYMSLLTTADMPQTVIIPQARELAPSVMPPEKTIAVRCPKHLFCQALLQEFGRPLVSTSVNLSGEKAAVKYTDINPILLSGVDYVVPMAFDIGATGKSSRIVALDAMGQMIILRD